MQFCCKAFLPTCLINNLKLFLGLFVVVSWISFVVPPDVIPGRMALLITLFLVLGKFPHCKHLEIYLQYSSMAPGQNKAKPNKQDRTAKQQNRTLPLNPSQTQNNTKKL